MALTNDEAADAFQFLAAALKERGLHWVVTQVEEKIALGKVQTKKLHTREKRERVDSVVWEMEEDRPVRNTAPPTQFTVAEVYTPQERLHILIDSIEVAVPTILDVAHGTVHNLSKFGGSTRLEFEPEAAVREPFSIRGDDLAGRAEQTTTLRQLLDELRRQ
jgi:hypothetical protein